MTIFAAAALSAAAPAVASADHDLSSPVRIAEVSADPRDGADTIQIRGLPGFTHLELRARAAPVDIHGVGLRLHDGRTEWLDLRARIAPGEQRTIELPYEARRAEAIVVDYGDAAMRRRDRTPARLELYGVTLADYDEARPSEGRRLGRADRFEREARRGRQDRGYAYHREPATRFGWR